MLLSWYYLGIKEDRENLERSVDDIKSYYETLGGKVEAEISYQSDRLPVLYVNISRTEDEIEYQKNYEGYKLEITGTKHLKAEAKNFGDSKAKVISSVGALQKLITKLGADQINGLIVKDAEIIYWLDRTGADDISGFDTLEPTWKITTNSGVFYITAYQ